MPILLIGGGNVLIINQLDKSNMTISTAPNTPRIRFKGFTEPWEKSQLKKEVDYTSTGVRACDISSNGKYDLYDANDIIGKVNIYASDYGRGAQGGSCDAPRRSLPLLPGSSGA